MNSRIRILMMVLLLPLGAVAAEEPVTQPAENRDGAAQQAVDPYIDFNKRVQERLTALGFYTGPINGDIGPNSQAALAQFQLSLPLPASGALDDQTVAALGLERSVQASAGESSSGTDQKRELGGSCDALIGPDKDRCLQQGGSVEASTKADASSGASSPAEVKGN
jgi:peptidoglycan hydrolase-like protein with peptidoglycan-binding domain